jgi:hypothetical protein
MKQRVCSNANNEEWQPVSIQLNLGVQDELTTTLFQLNNILLEMAIPAHVG